MATLLSLKNKTASMKDVLNSVDYINKAFMSYEEFCKSLKSLSKKKLIKYVRGTVIIKSIKLIEFAKAHKNKSIFKNLEDISMWLEKIPDSNNNDVVSSRPSKKEYKILLDSLRTDNE